MQAIYSLETHVDWFGFRKCHGTRPHTKNRNADDSGIRCATSYGLQGPKSSENMKVSRPTWFPKDSAGGGVTVRRREGPSSSGFSKGGYMANLMTGHRKM